MKRTTVDELHKKWVKNHKYKREYNALEEEFTLSAVLIEARACAGLTQQQVVQRMKTDAFQGHNSESVRLFDESAPSRLGAGV